MNIINELGTATVPLGTLLQGSTFKRSNNHWMKGSDTDGNYFHVMRLDNGFMGSLQGSDHVTPMRLEIVTDFTVKV